MREQNSVVLRGTNDQLDYIPAKQQRLVADWSHLWFAKLQQELKGGGQMDDRQTRPPNTGFDIFRLAIASVFEDKLGELVDGQPLQTFRNLTGHQPL